MQGTKMGRPDINNPFLNIIETSDGSIHRDPDPRRPASNADDVTVITKDLILDPTMKTWLRLFLPLQPIRAAATTSNPNPKLPLIVYFHGGGFLFCGADSTIYDDFCRGLAEQVGAIVISLDYRLAPEHRLPAAYEDAIDCLFWIKKTEDEWVRNFVDFENCYLCGTSAGGNLAYNCGLRAVPLILSGGLQPLKIKGMILHHPTFSGTKRTETEEKLANDSILPLYAIHRIFDLCLPIGANRDHEYCNPLVNGGSKCIEAMNLLGWRVLVAGCYEDPTVGAGLECVKVLEGKGVKTVRFFIDGYHAMEVFDPTASPPFFAAIKDFISSI